MQKALCMFLFSCVLALTACGGSASSSSPRALAASAPLPTGLSLTDLVSNNTSAASSFRTQRNGNIEPKNVSKVSVRSQLNVPASTRIYAHLMVWFGTSRHMDVGYNSADPKQVHRQLDDMQSRGIQGAIVDWYGTDPSHQHEETATAAVMEDASQRNDFQFAIMEDGNGGPLVCAKKPGCSITKQVISDVKHIARKYQGSHAYMTIGGRPVVFFFGLEIYPVDWNAVRAAVGKDQVFIFRNAVGFQYPQTNGGFGWVNITPGNPQDWGQNYLDSFYAAGLEHADHTVIGSAYKGFNDTISGWSQRRVVNQKCGQTWLKTLDEIGKFYSQSSQLAGIQLVTWNDYEEGTEIESGIDNCVSVRARATGGSIQWTLQGDEGTVDHYEIWSTTNGEHMHALASVPAGTRSFDVAGNGIKPGTGHSILVQAVGKPSLRNQISGAVKF